jgi:uncharacterized protein (TIGR03067 family)
MSATVLILLASLLPTADAKDDAKSELKKLQGKWTPTAVVIDGNEIPKDEVKGELVIKDNKYSYATGGGETGAGTLTLDPSKKPKHMDAVPSEGSAQGKTVEQIYELAGDVLKICLPTGEGKRPTGFKSDAGSGWFLITYKRAK